MEEKEREIWGGSQLRGWTLESTQGEPKRLDGRGDQERGREFTPASEFLQDLISYARTHQHTYAHMHADTYSNVYVRSHTYAYIHTRGYTVDIKIISVPSYLL